MGFITNTATKNMVKLYEWGIKLTVTINWKNKAKISKSSPGLPVWPSRTSHAGLFLPSWFEDLNLVPFLGGVKGLHFLFANPFGCTIPCSTNARMLDLPIFAYIQHSGLNICCNHQGLQSWWLHLCLRPGLCSHLVTAWPLGLALSLHFQG